MNSDHVIKYTPPEMWIHYDIQPILGALVEAKAAIKSLQAIPSQKSWTEALQVAQLKLEIEGTSRIEGADFTGTELEIALRETEEQLRTRSQRQAKAAQRAYAWIAQRASDFPVSCDTILHIHLLIVENADDDHCIPGALRTRDENVIFGSPRHRGVNGGEECEREFNAYCAAIQGEFQEHEPLVQALAAHYHLAAMHPFLDGNGRTARALEAFLLARAGLRATLFIAMSNYYYEEKQRYLETLASVRAKNHDLTDFLAFGLEGVAQQCGRLFDQINTNVRKALFENMMSNLYNRLLSTRKRGLGAPACSTSPPPRAGSHRWRPHGKVSRGISPETTHKGIPSGYRSPAHAQRHWIPKVWRHLRVLRAAGLAHRNHRDGVLQTD